MAVVHDGAWDARFVGRSEWLWPLARAAGRLQGCGEWPALAELDALYAELARGRAGPVPLRFAADDRTRRRDATRGIEDGYDGRIALTGAVPTRAHNWHDLLNALCFATWPRSKRALHARQFRALQRRAGNARAGARTPEQDALTLFDEGGVVIGVIARDAAGARAALACGELGAIVQLERHDCARVAPFGHALLEHLVARVPCPGASARVLALGLETLPRDDDVLLDALDAELARELARDDRFLAAGESAHLRLPELELARAAARSR